MKVWDSQEGAPTKVINRPNVKALATLHLDDIQDRQQQRLYVMLMMVQCEQRLRANLQL